MFRVQISGTGLFTPQEKISNEELVDSYNKYVDEYNSSNSADINNGSVEPLEKSSAAVSYTHLTLPTIYSV